MIYPADLFGPGLLEAIKSPLPQARLIPSAGVTVENMAVWFRAGACAVMVDDLFREVNEKDSIASDDKITMYARKLRHCFAKTAASMPGCS
jgi:2-dehydro-3-deoxyphosphogluconate aldolase/(4S)-4-hydroxy-2-oxoglutarate aldolase